MQLDEEIEKAFKAGYDYAMDNAYCARDGRYDEYIAAESTCNEGFVEYINGNLQSTESTPILDQSYSKSS